MFGDASAPIVDSGGTITTPDTGTTDPLPDDVTEAVSQLLADADAAFARADDALRGADLATYQSEVAEAQRLLDQARELIEAALAGANA